jgi:hypothetical protein
LSDDALGGHLLPNIGEGHSGERQPKTMRKLTGEGLYLHDNAGGKERGTATPRLFVEEHNLSSNDISIR